MNILITICARGGSKGIPGKNIRFLAGKRLIGYTIETAQRFAAGKNCAIALSSDAEEIIAAAEEYGLKTAYKRPAELATDVIGKIPVITDLVRYEEALRTKKFDFIIDMDVTSPFRSASDLEAAFHKLSVDPEALNIFSVSPARRNPYFNMVEQNKEGYVELVKKAQFVTRQSAPPVYDMNASFYIYRRSFFEKGMTSAITERSLAYELPHTCFDLDETVDFDFMEYLLVNGKLDFLL